MLVEVDIVVFRGANNYLGLANDPQLVAAAAETLKTHGFGLSSVRFICGTQDIHKKLERTIAKVCIVWFILVGDSCLFSFTVWRIAFYFLRVSMQMVVYSRRC